MGRRPGTKAGSVVAPLESPRGIAIREFKTERRIQVAFSFKGVECRELLPPQNITQTALQLASGLRSEIQRKIAEDKFDYRDYFPDSPRASKFDAQSPTALISELLEAQLSLYEKQVENGRMSPSTLAGYRKAILSERMGFWKGKTLKDATPVVLRDWVSSIGTTAKFARNLMIPLRSMFEDALNDGLIETNPLDRIALSKLLRQTTQESTYEPDPFSREERVRLVRFARADEAPLVRFWFESGLRPGELMALRRSNLDLPRGFVKIDLNKVAGVEKGPKTQAGNRDLELSPEAQNAVQEQLQALPDTQPYLWPNPRTGKPWTTDAQLRKTLWAPLCERASVRYRNPYQVRHSYASGLLTAGGNPWYVAQQLGHADVQMVFKVYGKFISADYARPKAVAAAGAQAPAAGTGVPPSSSLSSS
jgi:integrase